MKIFGGTKIFDLLKTHPFLEEFLVSYNSKFEMLKNKMARATIGRVATIRTAAGIANIGLSAFIEAISAEIEKQTGVRPETDSDLSETTLGRAERVEILKQIINDLHNGGNLEDARRRFSEAVEDVEATEIAEMEEELIKGGMPVSEVQRLCDVHVGAFRHALDEHQDAETQPGHPVHTYMAANKIITALADELGVLAKDLEAESDANEKLKQALSVIEKLSGIENHYQRKENQLFSVLERHNITGPSKVMWGVHDQIRADLKEVRSAAEKGDVKAFASKTPAFARDLVEMVYKEEKILFPMALQTLSDKEWTEIRKGEDELGYVLTKPAAEWPTLAQRAQSVLNVADSAVKDGLFGLMTGDISLEQLNLIMAGLPMDLSFVDENDTVRFYSEGPERIFPRSPAVIGRKVQNCHPPKSVDTVQKILNSFRAGTQNLAEFWLEIGERFIHIRYFAIRDKENRYRGCLEVSQDITRIRTLKGQRRLLEWNEN